MATTSFEVCEGAEFNAGILDSGRKPSISGCAKTCHLFVMMLELGIMRAIIDLPEEQAAKLQLSCVRLGISRAEAVRRAIKLFVEQESIQEVKPKLDAAFGLWKRPGRRPVDGLDYQRDIRSDWD